MCRNRFMVQVYLLHHLTKIIIARENTLNCAPVQFSPNCHRNRWKCNSLGYHIRHTVTVSVAAHWSNKQWQISLTTQGDDDKDPMCATHAFVGIQWSPTCWNNLWLNCQQLCCSLLTLWPCGCFWLRTKNEIDRTRNEINRNLNKFTADPRRHQERKWGWTGHTLLSWPDARKPSPVSRHWVWVTCTVLAHILHSMATMK